MVGNMRKELTVPRDRHILNLKRLQQMKDGRI